MTDRLGKFRILFGVVLLVAMQSACGREGKPTPATEVLVTVDSDMEDKLSSVEVQVFDARGEVPGGSHLFELGQTGGLPVSITVAPPTGKPLGSFLVVARGQDAAGQTLVEAKGLVSFVQGKRVGASLWLLESCRGVICAALEACAAPSAERSSCQPVSPLETHDVVPVETPADAGPPRLSPPEAVEDDAGGSSTTDDGGLNDGAAEAGAPPVDRAENAPTVAGFGSLSEPRRNAAGSWLFDDGFELGERICDSRGYCAVASFAP